MRSFNTSGPNIPAEHYTLPRLDWIEKGKALVHLKRYFTIWAPRQTGKSTYFRFLAEALQQEGYKVCHVNFEDFKEESKEDFLIGLNDALTDQVAFLLQYLSKKTEIGTFPRLARCPNCKIPF